MENLLFGELLFNQLINQLYDNSMGDYNYLAFSFIDSLGMQDKFLKYLIDKLTEEAIQIAIDDADSEDPISERYLNTPLRDIYIGAYFEHWIKIDDLYLKKEEGSD